jgi:hypothetical protein
MEPEAHSGGSRFVALLGGAVAVLGLGYLAVCVAGRASSRWPLEWMEGASVAHALRLLHGQSLYAAPSGEFIPFVYPPLSYLPMALSVWLWGPELWAARVPSLLALFACAVALGRAARHVSGGGGGGLLAAGLFGAGYGYGGGFVDLARVDAVFLALIAWGVERSCARQHGAALALCVLGCFAKQHAVFFLMAASAWALLDGGRAARRLVLGAWAGLGCGVLWLCYATDGWFWTYCVTVPGRHGLDARLLFSSLFVDLGVYLPVLCGLALYAVLRAERGRSPLTAAALFAIAGMVASALGRAHPGGDDNVRLPAFALLCVLAARGVTALCDGARTTARHAWVSALLSAQLAMLFQWPSLYWPRPEHAAYFERLQRELTRCAAGEDAVAMDHALLTARPFAHTLALSDLRMNDDALDVQATSAVLAVLQAEDAPSALAISVSFPALMQRLAERYTLCTRLPALRLPTGYALGPTYVYSRKP